MQLETWVPPGDRPKPPPLWLVSDGFRTRGPLSTTLLLRSAERGLSRQCYVRNVRTPAWRPLGLLREVRAADESGFERQRRLDSMRDLLGLEALLRMSDAPREALSLGLDVAARRLGADFGFIHCFERGRATPVTRYAFGTGARGRLGAPLLPNDTLLAVARTRRMAIGDARTQHAFRVAGSRLGGRSAEVLGVAMIPIGDDRGPVAMLELGRSDHPFRAADAQALRAVAGLVATRLS